MLSLILAAAIAQVYEPDFYCMKAQEDFVMDQLQPRTNVLSRLPADLSARVLMWHDPDAAVRRNASIAILKSPDNMRWMFWVYRSGDGHFELYAEAMLRAYARCRRCRGTGWCPGYQGDAHGTAVCTVCDSIKVMHDERPRPCHRCDESGFFEEMPDCPYGLRPRRYVSW